jgi:hypothetical protein
VTGLDGIFDELEEGLSVALLEISVVFSPRPELLRLTSLDEVLSLEALGLDDAPGEAGGVERGLINLLSISMDLRSQKLADRRYGSLVPDGDEAFLSAIALS